MKPCFAALTRATHRDSLRRRGGAFVGGSLSRSPVEFAGRGWQFPSWEGSGVGWAVKQTTGAVATNGVFE